MTKISNVKEVKHRIDSKDSYFNYDLREARINAGYSLKKLAEEVGISMPTIYHYENLRSMPNPLIARRIARILGKKTYEIFPRQLVEVVKEINKERKGGENQKYFNKLKERVESGEARPSEVKRYHQLETLINPTPIGNVRTNLVLEDDPAKLIDEVALADRVRRVLNTLTYREREIVKLAYGLGDGYTYTLEEIGGIFKATRERVRQIEAKAIRKLQNPIRTKKLEGFLDLI